MGRMNTCSKLYCFVRRGSPPFRLPPSPAHLPLLGRSEDVDVGLACRGSPPSLCAASFADHLRRVSASPARAPPPPHSPTANLSPSRCSCGGRIWPAVSAARYWSSQPRHTPVDMRRAGDGRGVRWDWGRDQHSGGCGDWVGFHPEADFVSR
jgi:hypothetical protein